MTEYCETCKTETSRCEYYPAGRSRQHAKCLVCDRQGDKSPVPYVSKDKRYCGDCDRNHQSQRLSGRG